MVGDGILDRLGARLRRALRLPVAIGNLRVGTLALRTKDHTSIAQQAQPSDGKQRTSKRDFHRCDPDSDCDACDFDPGTWELASGIPGDSDCRSPMGIPMALCRSG